MIGVVYLARVLPVYEFDPRIELINPMQSLPDPTSGHRD
jgi:hypothetical protein